LAKAVYTIGIRPPAKAELDRFRVTDQRRITDAIRSNLSYDPTVPSRNRKPLPDLRPGFEHQGEVWELRVGEYRAFYDVSEADRAVRVRAVRYKPPHKTTEEITR
jgi:mRNA-degrading endonuclease RelE of RelBE toxin-antitoxin system